MNICGSDKLGLEIASRRKMAVNHQSALWFLPDPNTPETALLVMGSMPETISLFSEFGDHVALSRSQFWQYLDESHWEVRREPPLAERRQIAQDALAKLNNLTGGIAKEM